jgi:hypothetical protein
MILGIDIGAKLSSKIKRGISPMKLIYFTTPEKIFITLEPNEYYQYTLNSLLFDGVKATPTFHPKWFILDKIPSVILSVKREVINKRFEINDPNKFPQLPVAYAYDDVALEEEGYI